MKKEQRLFVLSALVLPLGVFALFVLWPLAQAIGYSFTDWEGYGGVVNFNGFDNYRILFHDPVFWKALRNNAFLCLWSPILTVGIAVFLAAMLHSGGGAKAGEMKGVFGSSVYAVLFFIPQVLSVAVYTVMFQSVYNPRTGLLNSLLGFLGLEKWQHAWLAEESTALPAVLAVLVWSGVGFYVVILNAAMSNIPRDYYESASLDGASGLKQFWYITIPSVRGSLFICWIYAFLIALDSFAIVQILTVGPGGPNNSTMVLGYYIYRLAFQDTRFGYASALGVVLAVIVVGVGFLSRRLAGEKE